MDLTALHAAAERSAWPKFARRVVELARPSLVLAVGEGMPIGWYGGLPALPPREDWPAVPGGALTLAARIDCAAVAELLPREAWPLPGDGELLFFYDDRFADVVYEDVGGHAACRVLHVAGGAAEREAPLDTAVIPALPLGGVAAPSLPDVFGPALREYSDTDLGRAMEGYEVFTDVLGEPPRHRLLGWPDHDADPPGRRPLLQLDAEDGTAWGEIANLSFFVPAEDLAAARLDRAGLIVEVG
ncbi:DUF1963 domain-containing protein [Dactylosporangium sp. CA-092794]|uniref:DUF1963 domain-containing protein n=1 Tax=Dactylosporangium sp. CA-092794 TaxID=3239929 RepID=UPI003D8E9492